IISDRTRLSSGRTRESWWIKNDHLKFLTFPCQTWQHRPDIIRDKAVLDCWKAVQRKILATPRERFFGKIDVQGSRSDICRTDRKRARVGKTVQQSFGRNMPHVAAIFSLIQKQTRGIARSEVNSELQMSLGGDGL